MELSSEHKALFSLLRAGLWEREPDDLSPFPLTDAQWWDVYRMAVLQTVTGIVCRGLHHLPEALLPGGETAGRKQLLQLAGSGGGTPYPAVRPS